MAKRTPVSIGIATYNEEQNIGNLLNAFLQQKQDKVSIVEILVISSGSTDKTNRIVKQLSTKYPIIKLIKQRKRLGKASAVNVFLTNAKEDILILSSADIKIEKTTVEKIIRPFQNKRIGIVGSHPVPVNDPRTFFGFAAHFLWNLHHKLSLSTPKMGEFIAFRKIFKQIPELSGVDEVNIEALVRGQGYKAAYASECIIHNKGAENLKDFITRRRYIYAGHLATKKEYGYEVSTINSLRIVSLVLQNIEISWRFFLWAPAVIILEIYSRILGYLDFRSKTKLHPVWEIATSTKNITQVSTITE